MQFATERGRFTDKGTPGVILGRKAKALFDLLFVICDFLLAIVERAAFTPLY